MSEDRPPELHLLKAEDIPQTWSAMRTSTLSPRTRTFLDELSGDDAVRASVDQVLDFVAHGRTWALPETAYTTEERSALPREQFEEHDVYFGVRRVEPGDRPAEIMILSVAEALSEHIKDAEDVGLSESAGRHSAELVAALRAVAALLGLADAPDIPLGWPIAIEEPEVEVVFEDSVLEIGDPSEVDPQLRWRRGHQVFFVLMQGLILSANLATDALRDGDELRAKVGLRTATACMKGSAAALRYAGDFSPTDYARSVRPAMGPPQVNPKFSGLQARDHRVMLRAFEQVGAIIAAGVESLAADHNHFRSATARTYAAHKFVCTRFGGAVEPSLRMSVTSSATAADTLERLGRSRLEKL